MRKKARPYTDYLILDFYKEGASIATLDQIVKESKDGDRIEIMTHPAYMDTHILQSSYNMERILELDVLTTWKVPANVNMKLR
ncbi:hypothetical protein JCM9140_1626 [Halalkalibacter wakoensis JCM 9140]|uniref:Uncharacterized protein n=1 Tax=Halalkalibacter wakoensis JCM 9140 TaxID=1236970 RepID=W4Q2M8_9BACI|nr:hypothetical protein JCM9140_1626 [Halalkalibacter wakoensis JCM 9140]